MRLIIMKCSRKIPASIKIFKTFKNVVLPINDGSGKPSFAKKATTNKSMDPYCNTLEAETIKISGIPNSILKSFGSSFVCLETFLASLLTSLGLILAIRELTKILKIIKNAMMPGIIKSKPTTCKTKFIFLPCSRSLKNSLVKDISLPKFSLIKADMMISIPSILPFIASIATCSSTLTFPSTRTLNLSTLEIFSPL